MARYDSLRQTIFLHMNDDSRRRHVGKSEILTYDGERYWDEFLISPKLIMGRLLEEPGGSGHVMTYYLDDTNRQIWLPLHGYKNGQNRQEANVRIAATNNSSRHLGWMAIREKLFVPDGWKDDGKAEKLYKDAVAQLASIGIVELWR